MNAPMDVKGPVTGMTGPMRDAGWWEDGGGADIPEPANTSMRFGRYRSRLNALHLVRLRSFFVGLAAPGLAIEPSLSLGKRFQCVRSPLQDFPVFDGRRSPRGPKVACCDLA
jgi:hypothetical protein